MYKVFVNEKKLTLSKYPEAVKKKLRFENFATLEIAIDLLENTSCPEINVYAENIEKIWESFSQILKIVEAAGGVVTNDKGEILFIKRTGRWDLPKGKIEKNESPEQAALREIEEETGLKELEIKDFLNNTFHIYKERNGEKILKKTHWFKVNHTGNGATKPQIEEGISEVSWKNQEAVKKEVLPMTFENIKLILNNLQKTD